MIFWIIWLSVVAISVKCEPPVNSYLPPSAGGGSRPSAQYGPPSAGSPIGGGNRLGSGGFRNQNQLQDTYLPPGQTGQSSPDTQYGPPSSQGFGQGRGPHRGFGSQAQGGFNQDQRGRDLNAPSQQYGAPGQGGPGGIQSGNRPFSAGSGNERRQPQSTYGPPDRGQSLGGGSPGRGGLGQRDPGFGQPPESSYGPPPTGDFQSSGDGSRGQSPSQRGRPQRPDSSYGSPNAGNSQNEFSGRASGGRPSSEYGTPSFGSGGSGREFGGQGPGFSEGESDEPAKYEFSYEVDDAETGTKFGHSEQRDGDLATGEYNVVLPDGRKQVVEYEAGLQGYKPQIRYEGGRGGSGSGFGRGGSRPQSQGYTQGEPGGGFFGSTNDIGYPQRSEGDGQRGPSRYQQQESFGQGTPSQGTQGMGYSIGGPGGRDGAGRGPSNFAGGVRGQGGEGYPSGRPGDNGIENFNGGDRGYPSGGPQGDRPFGGGSQGGRGFSTGGSQGGERGYPSSPQGADQGYPSGGPQGGRGFGGVGSSGDDRSFGRGLQESDRGFSGGRQQGGSGYPSEPQGGRKGFGSGLQGRSYPGGRDPGGDEGYPSGGPSGQRGSGF
ncbi:pro-resilin-like isoform X1 [Hyposmocoma kahamanoa]|uniref:pro-resilin-like isoform X1 n=1 Tax=Hyposmocoma kahamanoa TaxID=1477025 RepID=UPI000E6D63CB|nr:pro-resilin-like isoform X1 [Hyposmocoma kahamanoa]